MPTVTKGQALTLALKDVEHIAREGQDNPAESKRAASVLWAMPDANRRPAR